MASCHIFSPREGVGVVAVALAAFAAAVVASTFCVSNSRSHAVSCLQINGCFLGFYRFDRELPRAGSSSTRPIDPFLRL